MATPDRNFTAEARAIDAMVWIDGVEVPFSDIEISFQLDQPSRVAVSIEPDEILELWRPKSRLHVWIRDPFPDKSRVPHENNPNPEADQRDEDYDKNTYMLFWEGEVTAISDAENSDSRQTTIIAEDYWSIPVQTDINLVEIGAGLKVAFINGSTFFGDIFSEGGGISADTTNLILGGMINYLFKDGDQAFVDGQPNKVDSGVVEIGRQLLLYLSQFNASFGLQAWRNAMFEKFTGIPDKSMKNFIRYSLLPVLMSQVQQMTASSNVFGYFMEVIAKFFHHTTTVPFPPLKTKRSSGGSAKGIDAWGELAIIPNLYYAFAPLCNWLFPEHYSQRTVGREYLNEPTRLGMSSISSTVAGFRTVHLAPEGLISYLNSQKEGTPVVPDGADSVTLARLHGSREKSIGPKKQSDLEFEKRGFYLDPDAKTTDKVNLLQFLTPTELEKGILYTESQNAYQEFLGLARLNASTEDDTQVKNAIRKAARDQDAFTNFMRMLAQYELNFKQVSRHTQISGVFNPWPVVGLPAMICREGRSYKGLLVSVSHRIGYGGGASTSYEMAYTQLFRPKALTDLPKDKLDSAKASLNAAVEVRKAEYIQLLDDLEKRGLVSADEKKQLLEAGVGDIQAKLNELIDAEEANPNITDMAKAEERFTAYRQALTSVGGSYNGAAWFDAFDRYAGYALALAGVTARDSKTVVLTGTAEPSSGAYENGKVAGEAEPEDERTVIRDQLNEGDVAKPAQWVSIEDEFSNGPLAASFWESVVRGLRLIYEELRDAVAFYFKTDLQKEEPRFILDTDGQAERSKEGRIYDRQTRINEIDKAIADANQAVTDAQEQFDLRSGAIDAEIAHLRSSFVLDVGARALEIARLENERNNLATNIEVAKNTRDRIKATLEAEKEKLRNENENEPSVVYWEWRGTLAQALAFFRTSDPVAGAADTAVSIDFFYTVRERSLSWAALLGLGAVRRLKTLVDDFFAAYAKFYGAEPNSVIFTADQIAEDFKAATKYVFQTKLDRFVALTSDVMDRINKNYKNFSEVFSELTMELPPLMPFNNDSLTRLDVFDAAVAGMVKPREKEGTFAYWSDGESTAFNVEGLHTDQVFKSLRQEVALRYDAYVRMARKIFPFNENDNDSEYRRQVDKGTQMSWANKLQARQGVTMAEFLERAGLKLEQRSAADPDTFGKGTYYVAVAEGDASTTDYNSYFSKLGRLSAATGSKDPLGDSIQEIRDKASKGSAPEWAFVRASVRQGIVEEYTKRHAVSRAFRGRR